MYNSHRLNLASWDFLSNQIPLPQVVLFLAFWTQIHGWANQTAGIVSAGILIGPFFLSQVRTVFNSTHKGYSGRTAF